MRRVVWVGAAAVLSLLFAGCTESSPGADAKRLSVMQSEPVLKKSIGAPTAVAGFTDAGTARRGYVQAKLRDDQDKAAPETARKATAEVVSQLRGDGWNIYYVGCQPPLKAGDPEPAPGYIGPFPSEEWWAFTAYGYKVVDGVSYFAAVNGNGYTAAGLVKVFVNLRAPNSIEPQTDLFGDKPKAVPSAESCLETAGLPQALTEAGTLEVMGDRITGAPGVR